MLVEFTKSGIYCPRGRFYVDPWKPVDRAILTHAHSDHARAGSKSYLAQKDNAGILKYRLGEISLQTLEYGEQISINGVNVSLYPAGHVIGSAQVRLEYKGEIWAISGDYKTEDDGLTTPFEPVKCDHFVTESTFGLPVFRFPNPALLKSQINEWVAQNGREKRNSVIIGYALGKSQRILHNLETVQPVLLHSTIYNTNEALGFSNSNYTKFTAEFRKEQLNPGVVLATTMAIGSPWLRRFEPYSLAICSGWMQLRGARRRRNADKGIVMSDHADWPGLYKAIAATGAQNIYVTHGYKSIFAKWLREEHQLNAIEIETQFEGENLDAAVADSSAETTDPV